MIGKNYQKFPEAKALIDLEGVISISAADECTKQLSELMHNDALRTEKGKQNGGFVSQNQGATEKTLSLLNQVL